MTAAARVRTSGGEWRNVKEMDLGEILDEMGELLAELTGLVRTAEPQHTVEVTA